MTRIRSVDIHRLCCKIGHRLLRRCAESIDSIKRSIDHRDILIEVVHLRILDTISDLESFDELSETCLSLDIRIIIERRESRKVACSEID